MATTTITLQAPVRCVVCGDRHSVDLTEAEVQALASTDLIQIALADVEKSQREVLISGIGPDCWGRLGLD